MSRWPDAPLDVYGEEQKRSKMGQLIMSLGISFAVAVFGFALGSVRAESSQGAQLREMRADIQKVRAMPDPSQIVTKDQLVEIVKRLDERTSQISQDVQYLRLREEKRGR